MNDDMKRELPERRRRADTWLDNFDERQISEIRFSIVYARDFGHGSDGHHAKMVITKLAHLLNDISTAAQAGDLDRVKAILNIK